MRTRPRTRKTEGFSNFTFAENILSINFICMFCTSCLRAFYNTHSTNKEQLKWARNSPTRVGYLIRNFRIASDMTQKELADKCGLNESTIRNYELGNRYPDETTLLNIANNLGVSFYALSDPDVANIFSALHAV